MSDLTDHRARHRSDFDRLYNLEDPGPYFRALLPTGYRMPAVLADALRALHRPVCDARDAGDVLRVLDFACGYGAIGALLRHDVTMPEIYAWYAGRQWQAGDARRHWAADVAFFSARRAQPAGFEIGGVDVAGAALAYAETLGFVDRAFHENLVDRAPGDGLVRFLRRVDLVVESGALGGLMPGAFRRILDSGGGLRGPWFLYSLRPDVDEAPLNGLWAARGYRIESVADGPIRYRKPLGAGEQAEVLRTTRALGKSDRAVMQGGYLLVDLTLARPQADADNPPIARLLRRFD